MTPAKPLRTTLLAIVLLLPIHAVAESEVSGAALLALLQATPIECDLAENATCQNITQWQISDGSTVTSTLSAVFAFESERFIRLDIDESFSLSDDGLCTIARAAAVENAAMVFVMQPSYRLGATEDIGETYREVFNTLLLMPIVEVLAGIRVCNRYFESDDPASGLMIMRNYYDGRLRYENSVRFMPLAEADTLMFHPNQ